MNKVTDITISHKEITSLHVQLYNQLRNLVLSGSWAYGTRIPSESQFAAHLRISRGTIRLALHQSEVEGLIERIPGRGTFVAFSPRKENNSRLTAFITCGVDTDSHLALLNGAENQLKRKGYRIIFSNALNNNEEIELLTQVQQDNIAGVLLWSNPDYSLSEEESAARYRQVKVPIVALDRRVYGVDCDYVSSDNYGGATAAMRHLIDLGHRHIVYLTHQQTALLPVQERYRAYQDTLLQHGLTPTAPWIIGARWREIMQGDALRAYSDSKSLELQQIKEYLTEQRPTAIFALNDYLAMLATRAVKLLNLRVPDHVSVVGFDDSDLAVYLEAPLTTVAQDYFAMGQRAAQLLMEQLEGVRTAPTSVTIPTHLRVRSSTAMPITV